MNRIIVGVIGFVIGVGLEYAFAQQSIEYQLKVSPAEVDIISEGLQTQPFGKVYPLINKLREQVLAQQPKQPEAPKNEPVK